MNHSFWSYLFFSPPYPSSSSLHVYPSFVDPFPSLFYPHILAPFLWSLLYCHLAMIGYVSPLCSLIFSLCPRPQLCSPLPPSPRLSAVNTCPFGMSIVILISLFFPFPSSLHSSVSCHLLSPYFFTLSFSALSPLLPSLPPPLPFSSSTHAIHPLYLHSLYPRLYLSVHLVSRDVTLLGGHLSS